MMSFTTFEKDPDSKLDYGFDWTDWLMEGDTISTSTWAVDDSDLVDSTPTNSSTGTSVWLDGGVAGTTYKVTNSIVTAQGREEDRSFYVRVIER